MRTDRAVRFEVPPALAGANFPNFATHVDGAVRLRGVSYVSGSDIRQLADRESVEHAP
jgi:hypothetical protein